MTLIKIIKFNEKYLLIENLFIFQGAKDSEESKYFVTLIHFCNFFGFLSVAAAPDVRLICSRFKIIIVFITYHIIIPITVVMFRSPLVMESINLIECNFYANNKQSKMSIKKTVAVKDLYFFGIKHIFKL